MNVRLAGRRLAVCVVAAVALGLGACGGSLQVESDAHVADSDAQSVFDARLATDAGLRVPEKHRAVATKCDGIRSASAPVAPPTGSMALCRTDSECTQGRNGRCTGNPHDGWACTYDQCEIDSACGAFVCECEGGFRSDNDVCLAQGNCRVDAECGSQYCSPTLGDCGDYTKTVGYYCHTPKDECIDDVDCPKSDAAFVRPYCAYDHKVSHWKCSTSQCAG